MICIVNKQPVTWMSVNVATQKIMSKVFFIPSFIDKQELRILCRNELGASRLWKSYMQSGILIFKDRSYDEAFTEVGIRITDSALSTFDLEYTHLAMGYETR
jgi:hypothetical protein